MFDLGWTEMMLIGVVALIVVGPKELPTLFRGVGLAVGKARGMAREFSRAMEAAADEAGVKEIDRTIRAATKPVQFAADRFKDSAGLGKTPARPAIPAPGTPLATTPLATPPVPLNPGVPLAAMPVAPTPVVAPAPPAPVAGGATEALMQRRAAERAALAEQAAARRVAPSPAVDEAS